MSLFLHRAGLMIPRANPAAFVFNGTDEVLFRTFSTTGASATRLTISMWAKVDVFGAITSLIGCNLPTLREGYLQFESGDTSFNYYAVSSVADGNWIAFESGLTLPANTWQHWVVEIDSTLATEADRCKMYQNGVQLNDFHSLLAQNESHNFYNNGSTIFIGAYQAFFDGKIAFVDVLEGVATGASAFAFDSGGTWTRKPYVGSYGTYGFKLDGTNGFNDVSGNGQNFSGSNMDGSNLDMADLPPYTN